jgi:hypothetical protein
MVDALILFGFLFVAFAIAIKWADSKLKQSRNRITDDVHDIDRELALNAEIRRLQGNRRIGDDSTERFTTLDSAGKGRDVTRGK